MLQQRQYVSSRLTQDVRQGLLAIENGRLSFSSHHYHKVLPSLKIDTSTPDLIKYEMYYLLMVQLIYFTFNGHDFLYSLF